LAPVTAATIGRDPIMARACSECGHVTLDKTETVCRHCDTPFETPAHPARNTEFRSLGNTEPRPAVHAAPPPLTAKADTCPACGMSINDAAQAFCGRCGIRLDSTPETFADDRRFATGHPPSPTAGGGWESFKTGVGAVYGVILCGIGLVVIVYGCYALVVGPPKRPPLPTIPADPEVISSFETKPGGHFLGPQQLEIKYVGGQELTDVRISVRVVYTSMVTTSESTEVLEVESWSPGTTQKVELKDSPGRSVKYSWEGTATRDGREVTLKGTEGEIKG
jgi:hypothetical protein